MLSPAINAFFFDFNANDSLTFISELLTLLILLLWIILFLGWNFEGRFPQLGYRFVPILMCLHVALVFTILPQSLYLLSNILQTISLDYEIIRDKRRSFRTIQEYISELSVLFRLALFQSTTSISSYYIFKGLGYIAGLEGSIQTKMARMDTMKRRLSSTS